MASAGLLYLSHADVLATQVSPGAAREAIRNIYRQHARDESVTRPKMALPIQTGHFFQALSGTVRNGEQVMLKWVSVVADNRSRGLPNVNSVILLSSLHTGQVQAVMSGDWITATRTAACSAVAASYLANPDCRSVGFIGCGVQARSHLVALRDLMPGITRIAVIDHHAATARAFAESAGGPGLSVAVAQDPRSLVEASDIVVSTVPAQADLVPFLRPLWLQPGSCVLAVDLARSWCADELGTVDVIATDDRAQSVEQANSGHLRFKGRFAADLAELTTGAHPGRTDPGQRTMFLFPGFALSDLAVAELVYQRALQLNIGIRLPL